jgi:hypothetical protein
VLNFQSLTTQKASPPGSLSQKVGNAEFCWRMPMNKRFNTIFAESRKWSKMVDFGVNVLPMFYHLAAGKTSGKTMVKHKSN